MRVLLEQNTPEWLAWRRERICASDISSLLGESDFSTPLDIYKIKKGITKEKESNFAMQRGTDTEPKVRALYALHNDIDIPPMVVQHDFCPFMGASLDGYNEEHSLVVEIKYPGKDKHEMAKNGEVPLCYRAQVQMQLDCAGANQCDYVSFDGHSIAVVRVHRDEEYIRRIRLAATKFHECLITNTPPPITDRDYLELVDDDSLKTFNEWKRLKLIHMQCEELEEYPKDSLKGLESQLKEARAAIESRMTHNKVSCAGVFASLAKRKNGQVLTLNLREVPSV